jgi:MYXO-CTERM domain-containing protein
LTVYGSARTALLVGARDGRWEDDMVLVDDDKPEGCGCATTDRSAAWVLLLAVVGLRRRRG